MQRYYFQTIFLLKSVYIYTSKKGFQFRAGVMPAVAFAFKGIHDHKVALAPYISFGKAF